MLPKREHEKDLRNTENPLPRYCWFHESELCAIFRETPDEKVKASGLWADLGCLMTKHIGFPRAPGMMLRIRRAEKRHISGIKSAYIFPEMSMVCVCGGG